MYQELKRIYDEYRCDGLWDLGDTTDDRTAIPVPVIDLICDALEPFKDGFNIKLVGNHEQWLRSPSVHAGKMFRHYFNVVETTKIIPLENVNIACVSYHDDTTAIVDFLNQCPRHKPVIVLGHFQVVGCQMASGAAATGVPARALSFAYLSLLGHIHRAQEIACNIHYVGSPFQQHWGEATEPKRVLVIEFDGGRGEKMISVPMRGFPEYRQVSFSEFLERVREDSEDRYKVVLTSVEETERFYAHPLHVRASEAIYNYTVPGVESDVAEGAVVANDRSSILREYMKLYPPGENEVDLDEESMLAAAEQIVQ